jgi:hypothetical protein
MEDPTSAVRYYSVRVQPMWTHEGLGFSRVCARRGGRGGGAWAVCWTAILATASSACQTERSGETAKPAANASVRYGGVLDCGMATELPGRALGAPGGGC